jgi:hypothetical protein
VLGAAHLRQRDPVALLVSLLRAPGPVLADLAIPGTAGVELLARAGRSGVRIAALPVAWPSHVSQKLNPTV